MDVGVVGTGQMGRNHVRVYSELKNVGDIYIYDQNFPAAEMIAKEHGATAVKSLEELLTKIESASVCVPTPLHLQTSQEIMRKGIHILIEKPICQTVEQASHLISLIPEGITVGIGHIERFNPIIREIQKMIADPLYVEFKRHNPTSSRITQGSVVEDLMIHDIDIVINCLFSTKPDFCAHGTPDVAAVIARYGHTPVYLSASRKSSKKIRMVHIEQEDMTIEGDFMTQEIFVHRKPDRYMVENERYIQENIVEKVQVAKKEPLRTELLTFLQCVKTGNQFPVTPEQGLKNLIMCEDIQQKMGSAYYGG
ncbi:MAG TPA: Gfo/Idh/MocA family oxidoreductase [Methanospirillum sp.]|nr:Gfo/Idh/MocA family oxidoreductase [Methanospirillum sp.]